MSWSIGQNQPLTVPQGFPAAAFAMEIAVDELCEKLGMDPLEFRLKNSAYEGTRAATGPVWPKVGFVETTQAAKDHPHYAAPLEGPYRGRVSPVASGAIIRDRLVRSRWYKMMDGSV